jgi:betaine-aldehyde dehydrogenase
MPHGGFKMSGIGKDLSHYALEEYTIPKHVLIDNTGLAVRPWHWLAVGNPPI